MAVVNATFYRHCCRIITGGCIRDDMAPQNLSIVSALKMGTRYLVMSMSGFVQRVGWYVRM